MVENDTIETVIGHARRRRALPGRSDQESESVREEDARRDMTGLEREPEREQADPERESVSPRSIAENEEGSWVDTEEPAAVSVRSRSAQSGLATAGRVVIDDKHRRRRTLDADGGFHLRDSPTYLFTLSRTRAIGQASYFACDKTVRSSTIVSAIAERRRCTGTSLRRARSASTSANRKQIRPAGASTDPRASSRCRI